MSVDDRPTLSAPDDDPWLWLEEIEGKQALDFVDAAERLTLDAFGGAAFERDRDVLAAIYDRPDNIPYVSRRGDDLHNLWKDATNPRGLWRQTTLAEFRKPHPAWEILLDIDQLAASEGEDWLLSGIATMPGQLAARHSEPVARRQRRRHLAGIRPRHEELRCGRIYAAGSQGRRGLDRCRYAAAVERPWRGHGDDFRIFADRSRCGGAASPSIRRK